MTRRRPAFTLFELLVLLALLALLFALFLPVLARARAEAQRAQQLQNLRLLGLACHNYHDTFARFPPGIDRMNFSVAARLLPFLEQDAVYKQIDFQKPLTDPANAAARQVPVKVFLSPHDPRPNVSDELGATNYLFSAGSRPSLKDNDGIFFQDSKVLIGTIADGTSNTIMIGETLKGDGMTHAADVKRQHVALTAEALGELNDDSGVADFQNNRNIAGNRCASWMDGRFLQGTFSATRPLNDPRPDVTCDGRGGLSALRSLDDLISVCFGDGSVRTLKASAVPLHVWKALVTTAGGEVIDLDF